MARDTISDEDLAGLIARTTDAAKAYIRGDMRTYFGLIRHADDFTLMSPFGGEPERGFDTSPDRLAALERFFQDGEAEVDIVETYVSGDLAVLVAIERQRGEVGGLPAQDWSLRVTWVFRRDGSGWEQVHRHADPLVHPIGFARLAALARGESPGRVRFSLASSMHRHGKGVVLRAAARLASRLDGGVFPIGVSS